MSEWVRVSKRQPCPECSKPDWCTFSADGSVACCMRTKSAIPMRNGGWLHQLGGDVRRRPCRRLATVSVKPSPEFGLLAEGYEQAVSADVLKRFAAELSVSVNSLHRLHVGWDGEAWTFPMCNASGRTVGIRRRFPNGKKLSVTGGREGLFIPSEISERFPLVICEGPTDCAAMLTLGIHAIGRPSCRGGVAILREYCRERRVAILADGDKPGRAGAFALAEGLKLVCESVRLAHPPDGVKDARAWIQSGGTRDDVLRAIQLVEPVVWEVRCA